MCRCLQKKKKSLLDLTLSVLDVTPYFLCTLGDYVAANSSLPDSD